MNKQQTAQQQPDLNYLMALSYVAIKKPQILLKNPSLVDVNTKINLSNYSFKKNLYLLNQSSFAQIFYLQVNKLNRTKPRRTAMF